MKRCGPTWPPRGMPSQAFQEKSLKRVRQLHAYDVLRADRCISVNSLEARVPFGDLDLVSYVLSIDPAYKLNRYGKGKYLLRRAFEGDWLPESILWREKAAFSDAVGHSMVDDLKQYAEGLYTDEEFERRCPQYADPRPFTKESLLYREIFEKYYPGQSSMIPGFWMPNPAWKGCDVQDPSARVLANYGDSGLFPLSAAFRRTAPGTASARPPRPSISQNPRPGRKDPSRGGGDFVQNQNKEPPRI